MLINEAMEIINRSIKSGYMVHFEHKEGAILTSDYFPDPYAGEALISTEKHAWALARAFAEKTVGEYINIYVIDSTHCPVKGYKEREIINRG